MNERNDMGGYIWQVLKSDIRNGKRKRKAATLADSGSTLTMNCNAYKHKPIDNRGVNASSLLLSEILSVTQ